METIVRYGIIFLFAFLAEMIDGGLGMGYGVSLTSFLLSIGMGTAAASASVHISEIFTSLTSGLSHYKMGNFDRKIFTFLVVPGVFGGSLGAYLSVYFQDIVFIKPLVSGILLLLGIGIIVKYVKPGVATDVYRSPRIRYLVPLGLIASFIDAVGGGGWGPVATPALVIGNTQPKKAIGSVNFAEFFVTVSISVTFLLTLREIDLRMVVPMVAGGFIAAPTAAFLTKKISHRKLGILVGLLIALLSLRTILRSTRVGFPF